MHRQTTRFLFGDSSPDSVVITEEHHKPSSLLPHTMRLLRFRWANIKRTQTVPFVPYIYEEIVLICESVVVGLRFDVGQRAPEVGVDITFKVAYYKRAHEKTDRANRDECTFQDVWWEALYCKTYKKNKFRSRHPKKSHQHQKVPHEMFKSRCIEWSSQRGASSKPWSVSLYSRYTGRLRIQAISQNCSSSAPCLSRCRVADGNDTKNMENCAAIKASVNARRGIELHAYNARTNKILCVFVSDYFRGSDRVTKSGGGSRDKCCFTTRHSRSQSTLPHQETCL